MKNKLSHGEAFFQRKKEFEANETSALNMRAFDTIPPRMGRAKAVKYYTDKLRKVFGVEAANRSDFAKVEDYYDYYEAERILNKLRG